MPGRAQSAAMRNADLRLDWLQTFVAVVDAGGLSAAAPQVCRSQSAVSMQLKKLEAATGQALLSRGPRHLALTPAGRALLPHARRLIAVHREALDALQGTALSGRVVAGVPDDYAARYFTPVLQRFAQQHAGVEIELVCQQSTQLLPALSRGEIDLALVSRPRPGLGIALLREPLVWVGDPRHEAWRRQPLPVALYEPDSLAHQLTVAALDREGLAYRVVCRSASPVGQIAAVESGLAVAVLTACSVPPGLQVLGPAQGLPTLEPVELALLRSRRSARSPAVSAMAALVVQTLGQTPAPAPALRAPAGRGSR